MLSHPQGIISARKHQKWPCSKEPHEARRDLHGNDTDPPTPPHVTHTDVDHYLSLQHAPYATNFTHESSTGGVGIKARGPTYPSLLKTHELCPHATARARRPQFVEHFLSLALLEYVF